MCTYIPEEGIRPHYRCGWQDLESGPLGEQTVFLTAKPSSLAHLAPIRLILKQLLWWVIGIGKMKTLLILDLSLKRLV